mgnify:CR=1 FL=1
MGTPKALSAVLSAGQNSMGKTTFTSVGTMKWLVAKAASERKKLGNTTTNSMNVQETGTKISNSRNSWENRGEIMELKFRTISATSFIDDNGAHISDESYVQGMLAGADIGEGAAAYYGFPID